MSLRDHIPRARTGKRIGEGGRRSEERVAKSLGAKLRPASGAVDGIKGDMTVADFLIEAKATEADSMTLKYSWASKISRECIMSGKRPALAISFTGESGKAVNFGDWVMIRKTDFEEMLGALSN